MSCLNPAEAHKIARLAKLEFDSTDIEKQCENLSTILEFLEQINNISTDNISPMAHPLDIPQRLRDDEITVDNQRELLQKNAPLREKGLYLVPKVIDICPTDN